MSEVEVVRRMVALFLRSTMDCEVRLLGVKIASVDLLRRVETLAIPCGRCKDLYVVARLAVLSFSTLLILQEYLYTLMGNRSGNLKNMKVNKNRSGVDLERWKVGGGRD